MDVSIIILSKNAGVSFTTLLQRLSSQKLAGSYEIIVLDSGSTDSTLEIAQGFPTKITRILPEEFHHGRTRNLGAELASGKILVYITQDALPLYDNWLQKLIVWVYFVCCSSRKACNKMVSTSVAPPTDAPNTPKPTWGWYQSYQGKV